MHCRSSGKYGNTTGVGDATVTAGDDGDDVGRTAGVSMIGSSSGSSMIRMGTGARFTGASAAGAPDVEEPTAGVGEGVASDAIDDDDDDDGLPLPLAL